MIEPYGGFILVHIATSVEVCEQRDRKGLYAKARAGILKEFTGISDPYEVPTDAEVTINTGDLSARRSSAGNYSAPRTGRLHRNNGAVSLNTLARGLAVKRLQPVLSWIC
jgi:sulfate adenylyltransferase